jgi:hypothetical protein
MDPAYKEIKALDGAFSDFRASIVELKPDAVATFDALQKQIDNGTSAPKRPKERCTTVRG